MTPKAKTAPESVERFLDRLEHPRLPEIRALRAIVLGVDPRIGEEVKWNAPSFRTSQHFATFHLRAGDAVQVVLHLGTKPRPNAAVREAIADPAALLECRAADRATVRFRDLADVEAKRDAFVDLVRQWITFLPEPAAG